MYFFVSLKEEISNKSVSETLESLLLKTFSLMLWILLRKIDFHPKKLGNEGGNEKVVLMSLPQQKIGLKQSRKLCFKFVVP